MAGMETTSLAFVFVGLTFIALGVPLVRRRIPRNRWYGFRVPKTFASEQVWYDANEIAGRDLVVAGAVVAATALGTAGVSRLVPMFPGDAVNLVVFVGAMLAATIHGFAVLRRM